MYVVLAEHGFGQQPAAAAVLGKVGFGEKQVTINMLRNRQKLLPQSSVSLSISFWSLKVNSCFQICCEAGIWFFLCGSHGTAMKGLCTDPTLHLLDERVEPSDAGNISS